MGLGELSHRRLVASAHFQSQSNRHRSADLFIIVFAVLLTGY